MAFLDLTGVERLWTHIVSKLGEKVNKDEYYGLIEKEGEIVSAASLDGAGIRATSVITAVQEGEGDASLDNIRPITGWDVANLYHGATYDESAEAVLTADLPETVYGGTLDWSTGVLTITHKLATYTGSNIYWVNGSNNFYLEISDRAESTSLLSNRFTTSTKAATQLPEGGMRLSATYPRVVFANPSNTLTRDEWVAQCNEYPVQLLYELAEYRTIQLDAQQLAALQGDNYVWSDCGDTRAIFNYSLCGGTSSDTTMVVSDTEPENPAAGTIWLDIS